MQYAKDNFMRVEILEFFKFSDVLTSHKGTQRGFTYGKI